MKREETEGEKKNTECLWLPFKGSGAKMGGVRTSVPSSTAVPSKQVHRYRSVFKYPNIQLSRMASQAALAVVLVAEENEHTFLCPLLSVTCQDISNRNAPKSYIINPQEALERDGEKEGR